MKRRPRVSQPTRPSFPAGYGLQQSRTGLLKWEWVERRLERSHNYWIASTSQKRRPHSMPVWGIWLDGVLYFGTDRASRKARNLLERPAVVAHLESGDEVVILEGRAVEVKSPALLKRIDQAYFAKYKIRFASVPGDLGVFGVLPEVVFAWREKDFNRSATRWIVKSGRK